MGRLVGRDILVLPSAKNLRDRRRRPPGRALEIGIATTQPIVRGVVADQNPGIHQSRQRRRIDARLERGPFRRIVLRYGIDDRQVGQIDLELDAGVRGHRHPAFAAAQPATAHQELVQPRLDHDAAIDDQGGATAKLHDRVFLRRSAYCARGIDRDGCPERAKNAAVRAMLRPPTTTASLPEPHSGH
jgi:hypothetical protein